MAAESGHLSAGQRWMKRAPGAGPESWWESYIGLEAQFEVLIGSEKWGLRSPKSKQQQRKEKLRKEHPEVDP